MPGYLLLAGGGEFGGTMEKPDLQALDLVGGLQAPVRIIPAAAAPDHNDRHAGQNGVRWFTSLGAMDVISLAIIDRASADDPLLAAELETARLVYLLGGFPGHLYRTLAESQAWEAVMKAWNDGAVIGGSSAGAMVLCGTFFDPYEGKISTGLGLIPDSCFLPHYQDFGKKWAGKLAAQLPGILLIGVDEGTAIINCGQGGAWQVYGMGGVTLHYEGSEVTYRPDQSFSFPSINPSKPDH